MKYNNLSVLFGGNPDSLASKVEFKNAVLIVSGNHLIITEHAEDGSSITGQVFPLDTVISYKAEKE